MPELPEVETVCRQLRKKLCGQRIVAYECFDKRLAFTEGRLIKNYYISSVFRYGKYIIVQLSDVKQNNEAKLLLIHLRMTGRLLVHKKSKPLEKSTRARFVFPNLELRFVDTRRFGTMELRSNSDLPCQGYDPLSRECTLTLLASLLGQSKQPIKPWLLRQDKLCGIGNIYASEILYAAKIHPTKKADRLSPKEIETLHKAMRVILEKAIRSCGTTFSDFQDSRGEIGNFQRFLKVYDRAGLPCKSCSTPISRIVQAGRSTYFCRGCQKT